CLARYGPLEAWREQVRLRRARLRGGLSAREGRSLLRHVQRPGQGLPYPAARARGAASFARANSPWHTVRLRPPCLAAYRAWSALAISSCLLLPSSGYTATPSDSVALNAPLAESCVCAPTSCRMRSAN